MHTIVRFPNKEIRAHVIARHVRNGRYKGVVLFTCGNAAKELRPLLADMQIVEIGPNGDLKTDKWWTAAQIHAAWPDLFDATSGHLPAPLMVEVSDAFRKYFEKISGTGFEVGNNYFVPTGSGETILCLKLAYPAITFTPVYDNNNPATFRDPEQPLNEIIDSYFKPQYWHGVL